jgi:Transposase DDE domain
LEWIVDTNTFANVHLHGNIKWVPRNLVMLAVLAAWCEGGRMTDAFTKAAEISQKLFGVLAIHTFQGLMRALVTYGPQLIPLLWQRHQLLMSQVSPAHFRIAKWLPLAVDGSRFTTPRTLSNEQAFSPKNYGKGENARLRRYWKNKKRRSKKTTESVKPQIWLTLVWHMGLKLPWCWKTGPSTSSERHHFLELLTTQKFPKNTLFCGDAGFVGYELWSTIIAQGHDFLIRVGGNVRLLKNLGHTQRGDGVVWIWPNKVAKRNEPPIILRLIEVRSERGSMFLVTNVMSERALSGALMKRLYVLRWGIELQFRTTKQTFGRGKLRSRNADHANAELEWSLIALTMVQLLAIREQLKIASPPELTSVAQALGAVRHAMNHWTSLVPQRESLTFQLRQSTKDSYQRRKSKQARYQPNSKVKETTAATRPNIVLATRNQKSAYHALCKAA